MGPAGSLPIVLSCCFMPLQSQNQDCFAFSAVTFSGFDCRTGRADHLSLLKNRDTFFRILTAPVSSSG